MKVNIINSILEAQSNHKTRSGVSFYIFIKRKNILEKRKIGTSQYWFKVLFMLFESVKKLAAGNDCIGKNGGALKYYNLLH